MCRIMFSEYYIDNFFSYNFYTICTLAHQNDSALDPVPGRQNDAAPAPAKNFFFLACIMLNLKMFAF
jgi:hypothetical protein